ncbi:hypothetical protein PENTCL1PPCAC_1143, partial [Pristionchus entomophagus]
MIRSGFVLFLLFLCSTESKIRFQSIGVKGTLLCGEAPTPGIRIRLWDNDMGELVDSPKQNSFTDFDGNFEFDDWTPLNEEIDPVIRIAHDCNDGVKPGQRLFKFKIPKSYVVEGKEAPKDKYFYLGTINLEVKPFNEERYYKGDIGKRGVIRPYPHKLFRARRQEPVVTDADKKASLSLKEAKRSEGTVDSSEDDPCEYGLCTFSGDRKRRHLIEEEPIKSSDERIKQEEEESLEDEGCGSEGACPIHLTRKRRNNRGRMTIARQNAVEESSQSDEIVRKTEDATGCSDGACAIDFSTKSRKRRNEGSAVEDSSKSDEIIKKEESEESGCSDGACPIDLSRKRRHESAVEDSSESDEIIKKEESEESGCSDGACP